MGAFSLAPPDRLMHARYPRPIIIQTKNRRFAGMLFLHNLWELTIAFFSKIYDNKMTGLVIWRYNT